MPKHIILPESGKSLAEQYPAISSEWDYYKNGALKPEYVTPSSKQKIWWKCKNCGMSWQAAIYSRVAGHGCPYDAGQRPIPGKTDLLSRFPSLAQEWDYERNGNLKPEHVTVFSNKKVWWKCKNCGMSWQATIYHRTKGKGCPYDAGKRPVPGKTDLLSRFPSLAQEWDYEHNGKLRPEQFTKFSTKKVWWKCKNCGMSWQATIANRTRGTGCPYDAGKRPIPGKSDFLSCFPSLAQEWDYEHNGKLRPEQFTKFSTKKVWWKCKNCGMSWQATIANRTRGTGCPYDAGKRPIPGKSDFLSCFPSLAQEWDYERNGKLRPDEFTMKSGKKVWWKCKDCEKSWQATIYNRANGTRCPICLKRKKIM